MKQKSDVSKRVQGKFRLPEAVVRCVLYSGEPWRLQTLRRAVCAAFAILSPFARRRADRPDHRGDWMSTNFDPTRARVESLSKRLIALSERYRDTRAGAVLANPSGVLSKALRPPQACSFVVSQEQYDEQSERNKAALLSALSVKPLLGVCDFEAHLVRVGNSIAVATLTSMGLFVEGGSTLIEDLVYEVGETAGPVFSDELLTDYYGAQGLPPSAPSPTERWLEIVFATLKPEFKSAKCDGETCQVGWLPGSFFLASSRALLQVCSKPLKEGLAGRVGVELGNPIPPEKRTRPMSLSEVAKSLIFEPSAPTSGDNDLPSNNPDRRVIAPPVTESDFRLVSGSPLNITPSAPIGRTVGDAVGLPGVIEAKTRSRKSTKKGDAEKLLIAELLRWHGYDSGNYGSCTNLEYVDANVLARNAGVFPRGKKASGSSTASRFFNKWFGTQEDGELKRGHQNYKAICADAHRQHVLIATCRAMAGDIIPARMIPAGSDPTQPTLVDD